MKVIIMKKLLLFAALAVLSSALLFSSCSDTVLINGKPAVIDASSPNGSAGRIDTKTEEGGLVGEKETQLVTDAEGETVTDKEGEPLTELKEAPSEKDAEKTDEKASEEAGEKTEEKTEKATEKPTEARQAAPSVSGNGYSITVSDGITYIGGIMIANKSYSLPASYNPGGLTGECISAFYEMQDAAAAEGLDIYIASGFRSYDLQESIYNRYVAEDGQANADTYSARPGHSEHQTGYAIDLNDISDDFAYTAEGQWVAEHCADYGFIIRYPADKTYETGYMYEPWHIRYVGVSLAQSITASGLCLEEYFGITSEYN